jgi:hypothetical protein
MRSCCATCSCTSVGIAQAIFVACGVAPAAGMLQLCWDGESSPANLKQLSVARLLLVVAGHQLLGGWCFVGAELQFCCCAHRLLSYWLLIVSQLAPRLVWRPGWRLLQRHKARSLFHQLACLSYLVREFSLPTQLSGSLAGGVVVAVDAESPQYLGIL